MLAGVTATTGDLNVQSTTGSVRYNAVAGGEHVLTLLRSALFLIALLLSPLARLLSQTLHQRPHLLAPVYVVFMQAQTQPTLTMHLTSTFIHGTGLVSAPRTHHQLMVFRKQARRVHQYTKWNN